jgi:O-antigen ligase
MLLGEMGIPATLLFLGLIGAVLARAVLFLGVLGKFAPVSPRRANEYLWLFAYLAAFGAATFYNFFDVTLFDIRINLLGWILLAAITGVSRSRLARFGSAGHLKIDS